MLAFYKGKSFSSKCIMFFTWGKYSHVSFVCNDGSNIEAWYPKVRRTKDVYAGHTKGTEIDLYQDHLLPTQRMAIEDRLMTQVGKAYDLMGLLGFLIRHDTETHGKWFCSELQAWAFRMGKMPLLLQTPDYKVFPTELSYSTELTYFKTVIVP